MIVGLGLAGLAFVRKLEQEGKTFIVFEDNSQHSSEVAGGMYNPVILKRFTPVWDAKRQLNNVDPFYESIEKDLEKQYDYKVDVYRLFTSIEEQNNWFSACDNPSLQDYLILKIVKEQFKGLDADFGYGKVSKTGRVATKALLKDYRSLLHQQEKLLKEPFNYEELQVDGQSVTYKEIEANKVVFCEGYGLKQNPFFNYLPLQGTKGELITIHAPELEIDFVLKSAVFVMPIGDSLFRVGATFNWKDKTSIPSDEGKSELVEKLDSIIKVPYTIVDHVAGIRPTVIDRRPLVGKHPKNEKLAVLNGLGTRGVMIAPTISLELYNHLENGAELRKEINISRFED